MICHFIAIINHSSVQMPNPQSDFWWHFLEQYFADDSTILTDGMCEATIRSLMHNVKIVLKEPENYQARAEIFACCSLACNGILSIGNAPSGWPMHGIEHALSAYYDITHGEGLAIITPRWMKHILSERTLPRFVKYGVNVLGIDAAQDNQKIAELAISETYKFFEEIGIPMHLKDLPQSKGSRVLCVCFRCSFAASVSCFNAPNLLGK